jgi:hypothetical protein
MQKSSPILAAAAAPAFLARGCVNVIELECLKEQAGPRWSRIQDGVYGRLEALLRAKLGPNDLFVRIGDAAYLITMPTSDPEEVNAICMRVAFDLHASFLGQCTVGQIQVCNVQNGDDDTLVLKRLATEQIMRLADRAGILDQLLQQNESVARASNFGETAMPTTRKATPETVGGDTMSIEHHFTPVWSVMNSAVTTYTCEVTAVNLPGRRGPVPLAQLSPKERIRAELSLFQSGITHLTTACEIGNRFLLAIPVSFDVLGSPMGRMELLASCRDVSHDYRQYLVFVIYEVPPGVAQTRLAHMVTTLRPFCRGVSATVAPSCRAYSAYQGIGLRSVGFDLREFVPPNVFCQNDAEQLSQFARRTAIGSFLHEIREKRMLKFALDARIQNLSGPAILPPCEEPDGLRRLTWAETLAKPVVEIWG